MSDAPHESDLAIGVLGGMGPEATADFLAKLVAATPVTCEEEHLRVYVDSNPRVPDRHRAIRGDGPSAGPALAAMARGLARAGADFVVMACNTAHAFEDDIRAALDGPAVDAPAVPVRASARASVRASVPFVSMIDEACDGCVRAFPAATRFGLLAADGCLEAALYQRAFATRGRATVVLDAAGQARFMALLARIKRGDLSTAVGDAMRALGEQLVADGAEAIVAACTEVPLVLVDGDLARPLFDPTAHLAARCVRYARRLEPLPSVLPHAVATPD